MNHRDTGNSGQHHWRRVDEIFGAVVETAPSERASRLEVLCDGDLALRSDVMLLLESDGRVDAGFLEPQMALRPRSLHDSSGSAPSAPADVPTAQRWVGRRIAGFTLTRCIGVGGMGAVYEAVQERPRRTVALKLIPGAMASPQRLRRFVTEAEILADLHHPNIAQVYEAGAGDDSPDAAPYMALELIPEAVSITQWVRARQPHRHTRLDLFLQVCDAVQYLHQRGVIHRDLKPANILVAGGDEEGTQGSRDPGTKGESDRRVPRPSVPRSLGSSVPVVKIIDFGVARLLEGDPAATRFTDVKQLVGTLGYMSPEQLRGEAAHVDTRSDVYALGLVLFEILTGRPPYEVRGANLPEAMRAIQDAAPPRLAAVDRTLRGDIETIVIKALEKQPERRYASVDALAEDIRRFRDGRTINARPPTVGYQAARWVGRHKAAAALVGLLLVCVLSFGLVVGMLYLRAEQQRARAEQAEVSARAEAQAAREVADYLVNLFQTLDPWANVVSQEDPAGGPTMLELLDREAESLPEKLNNQPITQAAVLSTLANVYCRREMFARAAAVARRALELRRGALGRDDPSVVETTVLLGSVLRAKGEYGAAESALSEALELHRRLAAPQPQQRLSQATDLEWLAGLACDQGRFQEAEGMVREALMIHGQSRAADDPAIGAAMLNLAQVQRLSGDYAASVATCREVLAACHLTQPTGDCINPYVHLSNALRDAGDYPGAEAVLREALDRIRSSGGAAAAEDPGLLTRIAALRKASGDLEGAEVLYRRALGLFRTKFGADYARFSGIQYHLVGLLAARSDTAGLDMLHQELLADHERAIALPEDDPARSGAALHLGDWKLAQGDAVGAEPLLRECADLRRHALSPEHWLTAIAESVLGECLADQGRFREAESFLVRGHRILSTKLGRGDNRVLRARQGLVKLYSAWEAAEPGQGHAESAAACP